MEHTVFLSSLNLLDPIILVREVSSQISVGEAAKKLVLWLGMTLKEAAKKG